MVRRILRLVSLFTLVLAVAPLETGAPTTAADGCSHFLAREDAQLQGWECPDLPSIDQTGFVRPELPAGVRKARVQEIVDGDTIKVSIGHDRFTVRLIGIDTPELHDPNTPVECYGQEAANYLASIIPHKTLIYLDKDVSETDRYDRLLRSVWVEQGEGRYRLVQDAMVRDGYAVLDTFPPDVEYVDYLTMAQDSAQAAGRGLWSVCGGADTPLAQPTPAPAPAAPSASGVGLASQGSCDPSYPGVCIPPVSQAGDLDCGDIPYRRFTVLPPDPHNFDGDHDGIGCES